MRGISPIVAVVLLIAIAVIASVGVWYWMGTLTSKKATPSAPGMMSVNVLGGGKILVADIGSTEINLSSLKASDSNVNISCESSKLAPGEQVLCSVYGHPSSDEIEIYGNGIGTVALQVSNKTQVVRPWSPSLGTWRYRQEIDVGAVNGSQTDYQVKIVLNSSNVGPHFNWTNQALKFTELEGTNEKVLPYWVEYWNTTGKEAIIWIKADVPGKVYMYYGNANATSESNVKNVFIDDIPGLVGFWDFDEGNGTIVHDKSGYGNDGVLYAFDHMVLSNCDTLNGWSGNVTLDGTESCSGNGSIAIIADNPKIGEYYNATLTLKTPINMSTWNYIYFEINSNMSFYTSQIPIRQIYLIDSSGNYEYFNIKANMWDSPYWIPTHPNEWDKRWYNVDSPSGVSSEKPDLQGITKIKFVFKSNTTSPFKINIDCVHVKHKTTDIWVKGGGMSFNGQDDTVILPNTQTLNITNDITVILFTQPSPIEYCAQRWTDALIQKGMYWSDSKGWRLFISNSKKLCTCVADDSGHSYTVCSSQEVEIDKYNMLWGEYSASNITVGVNTGHTIEQITLGNLTDTYTTRIGNGGYGYLGFYGGIIFRVILLNKVLPLWQITEIYNNYAFATPDYKGHLLIRKGYELPSVLVKKEETL